MKLIQEELDHRRALKPGAPKSDDVVQTMMEWEDDNGNRLTDAELVDMTLMYLNSGHDSSAHATMWLLIQLHRHPEVLAKVVVSNSTTWLINWSGLPTYLPTQ